jgi:PilZ domain
MEPDSDASSKVAQKRERRKESRHPVDGSAILNLLYLGIKMPGRVLDLSLNGCCIRTDDRYALGIYRRIEVELRIEGLPFRLAGVTQSIHNSNSVGIRFLDVSERKRDQLVQLIEDLEEFLKARSTEKDAVHPDNVREISSGRAPEDKDT